MSKNEHGLLSEREEQVLLLSTKGLTDKEIARKLTLSIATVNTYWVRIRTKLGGANRAELVAAALHKNAEETLTAKELENQRLISEVVRRAEAERALRESQSRLQAIIDGTPVVVFIKDLQGRYTLVNRGFEQIVGKDRKELLGKRDYDIFDIAVAERNRAQDQKVIEAGQTIESEDVFEVNGETRHFLIAKFPLHNTENTLYAVCGFASDITARKKSEEQIEEERRRYRDLFEEAPDGYVVTDLAGEICESNQAALNIFGCEENNCVGKELKDFVVQDLRNAFIAGLSSLPELGAIHEWELKIRPTDRPVFDASVSVTVVRDGKGNPIAHRWLIRDISARKFVEHELKAANEALERRVRTRTIEFEEANLRLQEEIAERKRAEEDLLNSHQFVQNVIESSVDGIMAFDRQCKYTVWNKSMEKLSGLSKKEVIGQYAFDLFPFLTDIGEDDFYHRALRGETVVSENRPYAIAPDRKKGFFDAHYSPIKNDRGEIIGGLAVIRESTEVPVAPDGAGLR